MSLEEGLARTYRWIEAELGRKAQAGAWALDASSAQQTVPTSS